MKHLQRFNGHIGPSAEDHIAVFLEATDNMNIEHEDVDMTLFVQSLKEMLRYGLGNIGLILLIIGMNWLQFSEMSGELRKTLFITLPNFKI